MPSTYTARNRAEKQAPGENNNSWGSLLNSGTIDMIDQALDGMVSFSLSTTKTLSTANGASDEARSRYINITGGTGGTVTIPNVEKVYVVRNASSGAVTFTTGSGTTADVSAGCIGLVICEGGNVCRSVVFATVNGTNSITGACDFTGGLSVNGTNIFASEIVTKDEAYTLVIGDAGKTIYHTSASAHTWTIPANASVAYDVGTVINFSNESGGGVVTIAITTDTLRWGASTGSRSLAANGYASAQKMTATLWRLIGTGIS